MIMMIAHLECSQIIKLALADRRHTDLSSI